MAVAVGALAVVWAYVALVPMAFLDDEYARWTAKIQLLDRCDLGDVVVLGDSRAAVGIAPRQIDTPMTNLAFAGSTSIEALHVAGRLLQCPKRPRQVILSLSPYQLGAPGTFWDKSVRYRLLGLWDLWPLLTLSRQANDYSLYTTGDRDGLPPVLKTLLHASLFPSLYFNSLVQNGVALHWGRNQAILTDVLAARGQYYFLGGTGQGSSGLVAEALIPTFIVPPILDAALNQLLTRLNEQGIPVDAVMMPVNDSSGRAMAPAYRAGLQAYLSGLAQRHPGFHVVGEALPAWPDALFNDRLAHFNIAGTARFSQRLSACLKDGAGPLSSRPACRSIDDR